MKYTGEDASNEVGYFRCKSCNRIIQMMGNYKDRFPPCPWEQIGTMYEQVTLQQMLDEDKVTKKIKKETA